MRIRYENTVDDFAAFQQFHMENSPSVRRRTALVRWGIPAFGAGAGVLIMIVWGPDRWEGIPLILFGLIFPIIFPVIMRRSLKRQVAELYREGGEKGVLGMHELLVSDQWLTERTDYNEQRSSWESIGRIGSSDDRTFIYVSPLTAHVIPRERVQEGDYDAFVREVRRRANHEATAKDRP